MNGTLVAGAQTQIFSNSLEPQPDGTLRGLTTETVLTNECAGQGLVFQTPFVATRTGDVPTGVAIPDPAGVTASPTTVTPGPPIGGPILDGAYRVDFNNAEQTVNGTLINGNAPKETEWWAFRSLCTPTRCVATGAGLSDNNQQEPSGSAIVLQFTDGHWQKMPSLMGPGICDTTYSGPVKMPTGNVSDTETGTWSLEPQPDATLHGTATTTVLTNECGFKGNVYKTPIVATRVGDVPPAGILADPTLF